VVVTGMGALTALGPDVASTWEGLVAGRSGIRTIQTFDPSRIASKVAAEVVDFDPGGVIDRKDARRMDRYIQFGLVVAREAMDMAGLPARLDGGVAVRLRGGESELADVVRALDAEGLRLEHLQLHQPSLDDVFLAKTGRSLEGAGDEEEEEEPTSRLAMDAT